jgi:hypothetical protein
MLSFTFVSCNKDDEDNNNDNNNNTEYDLAASADGGQETPAVTTNASGSLTGKYHKGSKELNYTVTWQGLSAPASDMHFHGPADPGTPANVVVPITGFTSDVEGTYTGSTTLTAAQETELLAGKWYFNVHTANHPAGEIRGQITATPDN